MREIKFRAISLCRGEHWVYGDHRHYNRNPHTEKWTIHDPNTGIETDIDETTIGQFTGLHDKNGKEIYEGDIIGNTDINHLIRYNSNRAQFTATLTQYVGDLMENFWECMCEQSWINKFGREVIGNIHDNPELLKGGEE